MTFLLDSAELRLQEIGDRPQCLIHFGRVFSSGRGEIGTAAAPASDQFCDFADQLSGVGAMDRREASERAAAAIG